MQPHAAVNAKKSILSPSVTSTLATKSLGEAIKNAKKSSPNPSTPGSPIFKRGQRATRRSSSHVDDMNLSESQVMTPEWKTRIRETGDDIHI